jgi:hypothetical protein
MLSVPVIRDFDFVDGDFGVVAEVVLDGLAGGVAGVLNFGIKIEYGLDEDFSDVGCGFGGLDNGNVVLGI